MIRQAFIDEHNRGRKVYHAISGLAPDCAHAAIITSGIQSALQAAEVYERERFTVDQKTVELDLVEQRLTEEFTLHRTHAFYLVRGMPSEGSDSDRLPLMDYKRAMDRASAGSAEPALPPSGAGP